MRCVVHRLDPCTIGALGPGENHSWVQRDNRHREAAVSVLAEEFGKAIAEFQGVQFQIARMAADAGVHKQAGPSRI